MNPTGKRRERQKAETRELILDSSRTLFETVGFAKTTMRAVASHAEIGLGTIYKHFANKADLLAAALLGDLTRLYDSAMTTVAADMPLKQQFIQISRQFYSYYTSRPVLTRAYLTNLFSMPPQGLAHINHFDEIYALQVTQLVEHAQKRGEIRSERDCTDVATSIIASYFYVLLNHFLRYNETDPDKMLKILERLIDQTIY